MKPLILVLATLFSYSAQAEVEALDFDINRFGRSCEAQLLTRNGSLIESFQERTCDEALNQCEYYLEELHRQGRNPFATCNIVEDEYAPYPPPYPNPNPPGYRPPGHHRPPPYNPPYPPPRPPPYNPPYPPPRPPPYNPPYPPPRPPPPPRYESWACQANDRGHEEHYGGHLGYGRTQVEAADNAIQICQLSHGRCYVVRCDRSYR